MLLFGHAITRQGYDVIAKYIYGAAFRSVFVSPLAFSRSVVVAADRARLQSEWRGGVINSRGARRMDLVYKFHLPFHGAWQLPPCQRGSLHALSTAQAFVREVYRPTFARRLTETGFWERAPFDVQISGSEAK